MSRCVCEQKYPVRQETKGYDKDQFTCCEIGQALIFHADSKFLSPDSGKVADASARVEILVIPDYSASKSVAKETAASFQLMLPLQSSREVIDEQEGQFLTKIVNISLNAIS